MTKPRKNAKPFYATEEQKKFIYAHAKGRPFKEAYRLFCDHFGEIITLSQLKAFYNRNKLTNGLSGNFQKGHTPFNKGMKGIHFGGKETQFKKGQRPPNYRPVGSERITKDDYIEIKVSDNPPKRWRHKHLEIWEAYHKKEVPKGHAVIFGDGNRRNFDPENLLLISRGQLAILNKHRLIQNDAELTKTAIAIADVYAAIGEKKRELKRRQPKRRQGRPKQTG